MENKLQLDLGVDKIIESFEVRSVLEGNAAFRAALTKPDTQKLEEYVKLMDHCADGPEFLDINLKFHKELFRLSDATTHAELVEILWNRIPLENVATTQEDRLRINDEHKAIVEALKDADANRSELVAKQHVLHVMADCVDHIYEIKQ